MRGPSDTAKKCIEMNSGDVLVFDPSKDAAIKDGVMAILPATCPSALVQSFGEVAAMVNHR